MPLMTKMRDNMPAILIGLVLAFVIMIIFEWGMDWTGIRGQRQNVLGKVNDRVITYQEFADILRNVTEMQRQQMGGTFDDEFMGFIRQQVWDNMVNEILLEEEIKRRGIRITDQEIVDWVYGENPPEFLKMQFVDTLGNFDRAAYDAALADPRNREQIIQLERVLRQQRKQEKLQSLLTASVRVTEGEIRQRFKEQKLRMDFAYVFFNPTIVVPSADIVITDDEMRRYYSANLNKFKNPAQRNLEYVLFPFVPSVHDTAEIREELETILYTLEDDGTDFIELVKEYSHTPYTDAYFRPGELSPIKESKIFSADVGEIVGPFVDDGGYHLVKIMDERTGRDEYLRAQHILLQFEERGDSVAVWEKAKELIERLTAGEDFEELARKYSADPGSGQKGGDLGWFGRGRMVPPFEQAAFDARIGEIVGPVETRFGLHIIRVNERTRREVKFATIHLPIEVSHFTRNEIYENAADFAYVADRRNFREETQFLGFTIHETGLFSEEGVIPGIGMNEAVMRFAFENRVGTVSDVIEVRDGYGVFRVADVQRETVKPLEEVKETIRSELLREKQWEKTKTIVQEYRQQIGDRSIFAIEEIDDRYEVQTATSVSITGTIPGVGRDQTLIGVALGLPEGVVSEPVRGSRGIYLMEVTRRTPFDDEEYARQRNQIKEDLLQTKRQQFFSQWLEDLRNDAKIVDNRYMFFR